MLNGLGTQILTGINSNSGRTTIDAGTLELAGGGEPRANRFSMGGNTLRPGGGPVITAFTATANATDSGAELSVTVSDSGANLLYDWTVSGKLAGVGDPSFSDDTAAGPGVTVSTPRASTCSR